MGSGAGGDGEVEGVGDVAAADVVDGEEVFLKEELLDGARYAGIDGAVAGGVINAGFAGEGAAVGVKFGVAQAEGQAGGGMVPRSASLTAFWIASWEFLTGLTRRLWSAVRRSTTPLRTVT